MNEYQLSYEKVEKCFQEYLKNFDQKNKKIALKIRHSYEVARLAEELAKKLYFTKEEIILAKIIGLLHDIGRFEQVTRTDSFSDTTSCDHADIAIDYLFKKNMHIVDFIPDRFYDDIIRNAIYYHNKLEIPSGKCPIITKFMKLIRDVDRIGIFYVEAVELSPIFDTNITEEVLRDFRKEKLISRELVHTESDSTLCLLAFLFDFSYEESFDLLVETDYLGMFIGCVDVDTKAEELWKEIRHIIYDKVERGI